MSGAAHASQRFHPVTASAVGVSRAQVANPQGRFIGELLQDATISAGEDVRDPGADSMRGERDSWCVPHVPDHGSIVVTELPAAAVAPLHRNSIRVLPIPHVPISVPIQR